MAQPAIRSGWSRAPAVGMSIHICGTPMVGWNVAVQLRVALGASEELLLLRGRRPIPLPWHVEAHAEPPGSRWPQAKAGRETAGSRGG